MPALAASNARACVGDAAPVDALDGALGQSRTTPTAKGLQPRRPGPPWFARTSPKAAHRG